jgi:DNA recombination protein RmuC
MRVTNARLDEQGKGFNQRLDAAARIMGEVQRSLGQMSEIGRSMKEFQEFLRSPKIRGNVGEQILSDLLRQCLPKQFFHLQYTFKSGDKVDAAIMSSAGIIPVDSKFPLENYRKMVESSDEGEKKVSAKEFEKDVRRHIDDISRKYILTGEGTVDYALMYVPSEAVYYEVVNNSFLFDYAGEKRVLPVSPTTFYAYIKAILLSIEGQKVEAQAREVVAAIRAIQKDYLKIEEGLAVLQKHINNAHNAIASVFSSFASLGQKITLTRNLEGDFKDHPEKTLES